MEVINHSISIEQNAVQKWKEGHEKGAIISNAAAKNIDILVISQAGLLEWLLEKKFREFKLRSLPRVWEIWYWMQSRGVKWYNYQQQSFDGSGDDKRFRAIGTIDDGYWAALIEDSRMEIVVNLALSHLLQLYG